MASEEVMSNFVVTGTQWGDEGKGKVVDLLARRADLVVRFGGGNNAGHTLVVGERTVILHLVPSGILHDGTCGLLGDGMVVDPAALLEEIEELRGLGVAVGPDNLQLSSRAQMILPYHRILDELREGTARALGTTRRGVGPAYEDRAARRGLRVGDLLRPARLRARLSASLAEANARIERLGGQPLDEGQLADQLRAQGEALGPHVVDSYRVLLDARQRGRTLLFEGAQGVLLDIDHGTYPFVTSSSTVGGAACAGAGVGPAALQGVVGVAKAYVTRVGEGPFPTELKDETGEAIRRRGSEYGATTGRPRRCGWLDLVALRYAVHVGGVDRLALTKLDVLAGVEPLRVCLGYRIGARETAHFPDDPEDLASAQAVLREVEPIPPQVAQCASFEDLPDAARSYLERIEGECGVPVQWLSLGPGREQTLFRGSIRD